MSNFRSFKNFFYFNREIVYLITMGYIVLIFIIVVLSMVIREQNQTIRFLQNGILNKYPESHIIHKPHRIHGLLDCKYRMIMNSKINHR